MNKKSIGLLIVGVLVATVAITAAFKNNNKLVKNMKEVVETMDNDDIDEEDEYNDDEYGDYEYDDFEEYDFEEIIKTEEDLNNLKKEFTDEYGNEDVFKKVYEDDELIEEVNGAQGLIRYTDKETNEVDEYNYFQELDKSFKFSQLNNDEKIQFLKDEFTNRYGNEDVFKTIYEDDDVLEEVNGAQGITRYKDKSTNEIEEINHFDDIVKYVNSL